MKDLVFVDVETTGLSGKQDRIIEIYMLKVLHNGDVNEFSSMINPQRPLPDKITNLTGITDDDLAEAPLEKEVAPSLRKFIGRGVLVAHNLAFDLSFLNSLFARNNCQQISSGGLDTLLISRRLFPKLCIYPQGGGSHRLKNLMYHFNLEKQFANSHRAKDDVLLLVQVYRHLEQYACGNHNLTYPRAMTHGCPQCGKAMHLTGDLQQRELICTNQSCSQRIAI